MTDTPVLTSARLQEIRERLARWQQSDALSEWERQSRQDIADLLAATAVRVPQEPRNDAIGLSIDMLDADRLRQWAANIDTYGPDLTHWASPSFIGQRLTELAAKIEQAVRDIGVLRQAEAALAVRAQEIEQLKAELDAACLGLAEWQAKDKALRQIQTPAPQEKNMKLEIHRCCVCGTRWLLWPQTEHGPIWNLLDQYQKPGKCCDNALMGDQIEHLRDIELTPAPQELREALIAAHQFLSPEVSRGPAVDGWQNTVDMVEAALARAGHVGSE